MKALSLKIEPFFSKTLQSALHFPEEITRAHLEGRPNRLK